MADLIAKADKKLQGGFMSMFTGVPYDEICDLYEQAINQLKLQKQWDEVTNTYLYKLIPTAQKAKAPNFQIASYYQQAADTQKKISVVQAVPIYEKAIDILQKDGKFGQAGKLLKTTAEILEDDLPVGIDLSASDTSQRNMEVLESFTRVRDLYSRAIDMFEMDDFSKSVLSQVRLKMAEICANLGSYREAIDIYESEGRRCLENNLLTFQAKDRFLEAGIIHLVMGDAITCVNAKEKYCHDDPRFEKSLEGKMFCGLVDAFEREDEQGFVNCLAEANEVKPLTDWQVKYLNKCRTKHLAAPSKAGGSGAANMPSNIEAEEGLDLA